MSDDPLVTAWTERLLTLGTDRRVFANYVPSAKSLARALAKAQRNGDLSLLGIPGVMEKEWEGPVNWCRDDDDVAPGTLYRVVSDG